MTSAFHHSHSKMIDLCITFLARFAQEDLAEAIHRHLPAALLSIFNDDYDGRGLLGLPVSKGIKTPTASEVSLNYVFLLPLVQAFPTKDGVDKLSNRNCFLQFYLTMLGPVHVSVL